MRVAVGLVGVLIAASGCERAFMIEVLPGGTDMASVELYLGLAPCEPAECDDVVIPGVPSPPGLVSYVHDAPQAFRADGSGPLVFELQASALGDYIPIAIAVGFDANGRIVGSARLPDLHLDESTIYRVELTSIDKPLHRLWFARQPVSPKAACVVREAADKLDMIVPAGDFDCDGLDVAVDLCPRIYDPGQRDFDGDARPDACDPCPHLSANTGSDPDLDADSDGVGDGCDPYPDTPGDRRVLWSGFQDTADLNEWTIETGTWSIVATGGLRQAEPISGASLTGGTTLDNAFIQTRYQVTDINGTTDSEIGVCAGLQPTLGQHLCCDVLAKPQAEIVIETWWTANGALRGVQQKVWPALFNPGAIIELDFLLGAQGAKCVGRGLAGGGAVTASASMPVSGDISGAFGLYMDYATARYDYMFVVESP